MKKNNSTEVLEVEEIPLEEVIEITLAKHNVTENVILALKENYGNIRLKSIDDKESFLEVKEARKNVRAVGILVEKLCKKGREDAVAIQKKWLKKESEILGKIAEVQDPLDAEIKKFDDEVSRKELEEQRRKEQVYMNRQAALSKYGATYNNGSFELKHISYESELIKQADEEQWNDTILPKYRKVYEEIEAVRVEEESKRKLESERLQKEREEFEAQQKAFKEQQELFQKQQAELQKQKEESERQQQLKVQGKIDGRRKELYSLGMQYNSSEDSFMFDIIEVGMSDVKNLSDADWSGMIIGVTASIDEVKKIAQEKQATKIAEDIRLAKEQAAQQERERIAEEQRLSTIKKQQEEQRKAEELALSGDKGMYADVISYLSNYPKHAMKSNIYKGKMNAIAQFIENL